MMRLFRFGIMQDMSQKERMDFFQALNEMIAEGLIIYEENSPEAIRLTKRGYDMLYVVRPDQELKDCIMNLFRKHKCKEGEIVMMRYVWDLACTEFNPKEEEQFERLANELIKDGYMTYEKDTLECIRLTKKGYSIL